MLAVVVENLAATAVSVCRIPNPAITMFTKIQIQLYLLFVFLSIV